MLVADGVEGVAFEDQRQIMHFDDPGAVFHQQAGDIGDKLIGIFEVVEHGDGSDDAKFFTGDEAGGEEIGNDAIGAVGGFAGEIFGRLESDAADAFGGVGAQESTVVAADVEDAIAFAEAGKVRGFFGDVREGGAHGGADAGFVPVVGIEPFGRAWCGAIARGCNRGRGEDRAGRAASGRYWESRRNWRRRDCRGRARFRGGRCRRNGRRCTL